MCGGTVVEDIDQYNRVHEMLSVLSGKNNRDMDDVSSVSKRWDCEEIYKAIQDNSLSAENNEQDPVFNIGAIPALPVGTAVDLNALNGIITSVNNKITEINDQGSSNRQKKKE